MRIIEGAEIAALAPDYSFSSSVITEPDEFALLVNFKTLSDRAEAFVHSGYAPVEVFFSRYYWFMRLVLLRQTRFGPDAGLDQQADQILEHPLPDCEPDWSQVEYVEDLARVATSYAQRLPPPA